MTEIRDEVEVSMEASTETCDHQTHIMTKEMTEDHARIITDVAAAVPEVAVIIITEEAGIIRARADMILDPDMVDPVEDVVADMEVTNLAGVDTATMDPQQISDLALDSRSSVIQTTAMSARIVEVARSRGRGTSVRVITGVVDTTATRSSFSPIGNKNDCKI